MLLTTRFGVRREFWPWSVVSAVVPGAGAIRAVSRVGLLVLVAWAAGLALAVQALRRRSLAAAATLAALCLLEQGATFDHFVPAAERRCALAVGRSVPPGCSAFAYAPDADGWPAWRAQLDAVWAADEAGIPTLNGYTGNIPPGWPLEDCLVRQPEDRPDLGRGRGVERAERGRGEGVPRSGALSVDRKGARARAREPRPGGRDAIHPHVPCRGGGVMTRFTRMQVVFSLAFALALLSCATPSNQSPSNQQTPPLAGGTGWVPGDPLDTPVSDGTPVQLPGAMADGGAAPPAR